MLANSHIERRGDALVLVINNERQAYILNGVLLRRHNIIPEEILRIDQFAGSRHPHAVFFCNAEEMDAVWYNTPINSTSIPYADA